MLKVSLSFLVLSFVSQAFSSINAKELRILQGDFALSERVESTLIRRTERISVLSAAGAEKLKELRRQGYRCHAQTPVRWSCSLNLDPGVLSEEIISKLQAKWSGLLISLRVPAGPPNLMQNIDGLKVWSVPQKIFVRTSQIAEPRTWEQVTYLRNTNVPNSPWMIYFGDYRDQDAPALFILDQETLIAQDIVEIGGDNVSIKYFVDLYISRIQ